jgi:hypothetical protein
MKKSSGQLEQCVSVGIFEEMKISALRILEKVKSTDTAEAQCDMKEYNAWLIASTGPTEASWLQGKQCCQTGR